MNPNLKRLMPCLGLLVLLAGCSSESNPVAPIVVPPLSSLVVTPAADTLDVGESRLFAAAAVDTAGDPYTGALVWTSTNTGVFTVGATGLVTAQGEGAARLVVSGGGLADTADVLVYPTAAGWIVQTSNAAEDLRDVFADTDGRLVWVVGDGGLVLSSADAGASWTRRTPSTYDLYGVWFTSASEGWAVGDGGTVLHTLNGGAGWTRLTTVGSGESLRDVYFASRDVGWVVGTNGQVLATRDRGQTWSKLWCGGQTLNGVMFAGADGWAVGENGVVIGSHDAGVSWFVVNPSLTVQPLRGVWRRSTERAVAVGLQGVVLGTAATADSVAWSLGNAGGLYQCAGVCLLASGAGYAVGWNGTTGFVLRSDDDGVTWRPQAPASASPLRGVFFLDARRGWAVGDDGVIRHTASGGE
jgi:photosystem II stability/assembly factor-like uncharacterized protein